MCDTTLTSNKRQCTVEADSSYLDSRAAGSMELEALQARLGDALEQASSKFQKVPGSAVLVRYIQSSYQNDPVRSAIELVLVLFFIRYLLSPSYSTRKQNYVKLRKDARRASHAQWRSPADLSMEWTDDADWRC